MKQRAPALSDSTTFQQLWDTLGSKLIESARGNLLYTQGVRDSNHLPHALLDLNRHRLLRYVEKTMSVVFSMLRATHNLNNLLFEPYYVLI